MPYFYKEDNVYICEESYYSILWQYFYPISWKFIPIYVLYYDK